VICTQCNTARDFAAYRFYSPACIHCGARLIQRLALRDISNAECTALRKVVLADWVAWGHNEAEIRRLVKGEPAIAPK
jgi:hypothetical protein